jgi:phosphoribosylanthranilate isomerase
MLKLRVKLGQVSNLSDARYAAGMGVEAIGFNIDKDNPNYLDAKMVTEIMQWVSGVKIVVETGGALPDGLEEYKFDYVEVRHPDLLDDQAQYILKITVNKDNLYELESILAANANKVIYFVLIIAPPELAELGQELKVLAQTFPLFISSDFSPESLYYVLEVVQPEGIELKGGKEDKPGFKDYSGIADILELLEQD